MIFSFLLVFGITVTSARAAPHHGLLRPTISLSRTERLQGALPSPTSFPSRVIYQSPKSLFLENIAVRATSDLLLTSVASPTLFALDPHTTNGTLTEVHTFVNASSLSGITEYSPGVFAVASSLIDLATRRAVPGSTVIWSVEFNHPTPAVHPISHLPGNASVNGLTSIPGIPDILLSADSSAGAIRQINARTGESQLVIQDVSMLPNAPPPALGINGLHLRDTSIYFTNSAQGTLSRVGVHPRGGNLTMAGAVELLTNIQPLGKQQAPDDFALDREGRAWVAVHPGALALLSPPANGRRNFTQATALGNDEGTFTGLNQSTSAAFGRGSTVQERILYVATGVGQVVAVDTMGGV
ncbi:hypothetical protein DFH06DRAFT_1088404 [Mycena polygramma]|nr:hypothetical protein DFH06DRAFT_1088404 [Mycena polygramma]